MPRFSILSPRSHSCSRWVSLTWQLVPTSVGWGAPWSQRASCWTDLTWCTWSCVWSCFPQSLFWLRSWVSFLILAPFCPNCRSLYVISPFTWWKALVQMNPLWRPGCWVMCSQTERVGRNFGRYSCIPISTEISDSPSSEACLARTVPLNLSSGWCITSWYCFGQVSPHFSFCLC